MPLPALPNWQPTRTALHMAAQVISAVRVAATERLPNHLHHSLTPTPDGVTTGEMPHLGAFTVDYRAGTVVHTHNGAAISAHKLAGATQAGLFAALSDEIHELEYDLALPSPGDMAEGVLQFDPAHGAAFADMGTWAFAVIANAKAHTLGFQTPLVLWSHGFDLSTLVFVRGSVEEADPHLNMGFSPGTADHPTPYLYIYAFPEQAALRDALPDGWTWETSWGTPGGLVPYDALGDATGDQLMALVRASVGPLAAS
jgi:hypothetical protein